LETAQCCRRIHHLHIQGQRVNQARNQQKKVGSWYSDGFLLGLPFNHEDGGDMLLWNVVSELHGVTTQNILLFSQCHKNLKSNNSLPWPHNGALPAGLTIFPWNQDFELLQHSKWKCKFKSDKQLQNLHPFEHLGDICRRKWHTQRQQPTS
jgi:hypothetical protein